jgi:hypothetical protein
MTKREQIIEILESCLSPEISDEGITYMRIGSSNIPFIADAILALQPEQSDGLQKYNVIDRELKRAEIKHPIFPDSMFTQLAIMQEEAGEVTKAVLHYHYENGTVDEVRNELIHTAAMCMRMLQNLPNTNTKP